MTDKQLAQTVWDYMRYEQPLEKADLILGLGGPDIETADYCAQLYMDGWAPKLLFTGTPGVNTHDLFSINGADFSADRAISLGVPKADVIIEDRATNTGENMRFSHALLNAKGLTVKKLILVHSPYMLRRDYATFLAQWEGHDIPKVICSALSLTMEQYCNDDPDIFTTMTEYMLGDLQRLIEYPLMEYEVIQEIPSNIIAAYKQLVARGYTKHLL